MANFTNNRIKNTYQRVLQEHGGELQNGLGEPLTGSLSLSGSLNVTGSLVVKGDVTARSVITQLTQSTVLYSSGSTKFGDTTDDTHQFTGSLIAGGGITGSLLSTNGILSSSTQIATDISGSFTELSSSAASRIEFNTSNCLLYTSPSPRDRG